MILQILKYAGFAFLLYGALVALAYVMQRSLIYITSPLKPSLSQTIVADVKEVSIATEDGLALAAWYKPPASSAHPVILRFHGNAGNVWWSMDSMKAFAAAGFGVLAAEYRGYSGNPGTPDEEGLYKDARAHIEWLKTQGITDKDIILFGESIGSSPAVQMALEYPDAGMLVLLSPFTSLVDTASVHYPLLPVTWLLKDRHDNLSRIGKIRMPLAIAHGTSDIVVPYVQGKKLFEAAPESKIFLTLDGAGHNDLWHYGAEQKIMTLIVERWSKR